jgi:hypothetical protein
MRTTLTLDPDVAAEIERRRRSLDRSLKEEINHLLRLGLRHAEETPDRTPFRTETASVGRILAPDLTDVADTLAYIEGERFG